MGEAKWSTPDSSLPFMQRAVLFTITQVPQAHLVVMRDYMPPGHNSLPSLPTSIRYLGT
jgi:hypothetical protein